MDELDFGGISYVHINYKKENANDILKFISYFMNGKLKLSTGRVIYIRKFINASISGTLITYYVTDDSLRAIIITSQGDCISMENESLLIKETNTNIEKSRELLNEILDEAHLVNIVENYF